MLEQWAPVRGKNSSFKRFLYFQYVVELPIHSWRETVFTMDLSERLSYKNCVMYALVTGRYWTCTPRALLCNGIDAYMLKGRGYREEIEVREVRT